MPSGPPPLQNPQLQQQQPRQPSVVSAASDAISNLSISSPGPQPTESVPSSTSPGKGKDGKESTYRTGQRVYYKSSSYSGPAEVVKVHLDDDLVPYYTVRVEGKEKQTDDSHLSASHPLQLDIEQLLPKLTVEQLQRVKDLVVSQLAGGAALPESGGPTIASAPSRPVPVQVRPSFSNPPLLFHWGPLACGNVVSMMFLILLFPTAFLVTESSTVSTATTTSAAASAAATAAAPLENDDDASSRRQWQWRGIHGRSAPRDGSDANAWAAADAFTPTRCAPAFTKSIETAAPVSAPAESNPATTRTRNERSTRTSAAFDTAAAATLRNGVHDANGRRRRWWVCRNSQSHCSVSFVCRPLWRGAIQPPATPSGKRPRRHVFTAATVPAASATAATIANCHAATELLPQPIHAAAATTTTAAAATTAASTGVQPVPSPTGPERTASQYEPSNRPASQHWWRRAAAVAQGQSV